MKRLQTGYAVNLTSDQLLRANTSGMKLVCDKIDFSAFTLPEKKAFMANRRASVACLAMKDLNPKDDDIIVIADADILYRKKLVDLRNLMEKVDVGCIFRDGMWNGKTYNHLKVACGFVALKKTGNELVILWDILMKCNTSSLYGIQPNQWYWDQVTLLKAIEILNALSYAKLEHDTYVNRDFDENAVAWSAHKPPKELMFEKFNIELGRMKNG